MNDMKKPVVVPAIGIEPGFDAELVRLLGDYKKNRTGYGVAYGKPETEETKEELDRLHRAYWEAIHAMEKLPATGPLGLAAKAEIIQEYMPDSDDAMHGLALSLAADCIRLGALPTASSPDAELLILCAEFHRTQAELDQWCATGRELEPPMQEEEAHHLWEEEDSRFFDANSEVFDALIDMPAKTGAGIAAKANVLATRMNRLGKGRDSLDAHDVFAHVLVQNAAQLAGGVA